MRRILQSISTRENERMEVIEVRVHLLERILIPVLAFGLVAAVLGAVQTYRQGRWLFSIVYIVLYLTILLTTCFKRRFSFSFRALILLVNLFLISVAILARIGMSGIGMQIMIAVCVLAGTMLGIRAGLLTIGLTLFTIGGIATGMVLGYIKIHPEHMMTSLSPLAWGTAGAAYVMITLCLVIVPHMFVGRLKKSLEMIERHSELLERSNLELKKEIETRKAAEKALMDSEERFKEMADSISEVFWLFDVHKQRVIYASPAYETIWGRSVQALYDRYAEWGESIHPDDLEYAGESFERIIKTGGGEAREYRIVRPEGSVRWVSDRGFAIRDDHGNIYRIAGIAQDITDRKRSEEELIGEKERFRVLVEESPFGVSMIDKEGRYRYLNPKFIEMFGYTLEEIRTGREWFEKAFPDPEYRKKIVAVWKEDQKESGIGEARPRKYTVTCKDGAEKIIHFRPVTLRDQGQFVIYEDISEEKRLQERLQQAQRMEAIGTLAGGVAHDFNNLLMGIQGRASLMLMDTKTDDPNYQHLIGIEEYVKSAADLTGQLLGFAKGGKYQVKTLNPNDLIRKTAEMFGRTKKEIVIHLTLHEDLWNIEADTAQIEQVMLNLYVNAWQAMPGGGQLIVQTGNVVFDENDISETDREPGRYVKISITDTGVGMDEKTKARIFDPFFTTKELGRGTGLGLASVYGIVRNHGGSINVYSEKGQGATFSLYLPASDKEIRVEKDLARDELLRGDETVLLVDDETASLEVGMKMLERLGYTVSAARGGDEAIRIYRENRDAIRLVVLDMIMPGMGGAEVYEQLAEIDPDVRVLLSSGYSMNGKASELLEKGCSGFIQKPFNLYEISKKIREILDQQA